MSKKILIAIPARMLSAIDILAKKECRSRSDLVRESLRKYVKAAGDEFQSIEEILEPEPVTAQ